MGVKKPGASYHAVKVRLDSQVPEKTPGWCTYSENWQSPLVPDVASPELNVVPPAKSHHP